MEVAIPPGEITEVIMRLALDAHNDFIRLTLALVFITAVAVLVAECPSLGQYKEPLRVQGFEPDVPHLMEAREGILTGGQPTQEGLRRLAGRGIRTIVNLRPHTESGARDESVEAANLGMTYIPIPVTSSTFTLSKMQDLHCVLEPILLQFVQEALQSGAQDICSPA
jgi:hypothetical protein